MPILCYHAINESWDSPLSVKPSDFAEQCDWLARHRTVIDVVDAAARIDRHGRLARGEVALTFDDGLASVYTEAFPVIRRYKLPTTVYLVAETLRNGQDVDWVDDPPENGLGVLTAVQIEEMADAGIEFGSHSLHHHTLTDLTYEECVADLRDSREILEDVLRRPITTLAYPRGIHDDQVRRAAAAAGYEWSFGLPQGPEPIGRQSIPRVGIFRDNGHIRFRTKLSEWYLAVRTSSAYTKLRRT